MFTGLVSAVGRVRRREEGDKLVRLEIESPYPLAALPIGASVSHDGCCLTLVEARADGPACIHAVEIAAESLARTTLGALREGDQVNLELSLKLGDELGGHLVTGHVDAVAEVLSVTPDGAGRRIRIALPASLALLVAAKGSIAVDGVSLTVNEVDASSFGVLIIPHTWEVTTLGGLKAGDRVNLEVDLLARYVARIMDVKASS